MSAAKKPAVLHVNPLAQVILGVANVSAPESNGVYDPNVTTKGEHAWRKRIERTEKALQDVCTEKQLSVLETIAVDALDFGIVADGFRATMRQHVNELHPSGKVGYATYNPIVAALRVNFGDYAAKAYRDAVRGLSGMRNTLPTKGTGTGEGVKGLTASKWYQGVHRRIEEITERMSKVPAGDIDGDAMRAFNDAYRALVRADATLKRAIVAHVKA